MLTFESPFYEIEDVIVFRDHASPTTFHYLAGPPHLTVDDAGKPTFLMLKYKNAIDTMSTGAGPTRDQLGGAFVMLGVDCGLSQATKDTITSKLQDMAPKGAGAISLVPVLYTKGKVSVIALDQQPKLSPEVHPGIEPGPPPYHGGVRPQHLQTERVIPDGLEPSLPGCGPGVVAAGPRDQFGRMKAEG